MVKTTTAGMDAHLAEEVTSLATLWRITRMDGQEFFFTDHDVDIVYVGNTYRADTGYRRTAMHSDVSLAVDNLDVEGIFDSDAITEAELRAGLYDHAQVRVYVINWADPTSDGAVKMRNGRLGEVTLSTYGVFKAELRGMTQALSRRIVEIYQPECRADLGDERCKVPVQPDLRENSIAYSVGDFVRIATDGNGRQAPSTRLLVPLDADGDDVSIYAATGTLGTEASVQGTTKKYGTGALELTPTVTVDPSESYVSWSDATHYSLGSSDFTIEGWVRFKDLTSTEQVIASHYLNTGNERAWYVERNGSTLQAKAYQTGGVVQLVLLSGSVSWAIDTWYHVAFTRDGDDWYLFLDGALVDSDTQSGPVNNSAEVLRLGKRRSAGSDDMPLDGFLDDWRIYVGEALYTAAFTPPASAHDVEPTTAQQSAYENRIYECTYAGTSGASAPTTDTTIGNETLDGWTAATGVLTVTANPSNTETVTIGSKVYEFVNSLSAANDVLIEVAATDTLDNLVAAINGDAGEGSKYGTGTTANTDATAEKTDTLVVTVTAIIPAPSSGNDAGNDVATTETLADGSWGTTTMDGGVVGLIWTARNAWTRHAWVTSSPDNSTLVLDVTGYAESRDVDDWYNGGVLTFEDGYNNGRAIEIRDWANSSRTVTLFLPAYYAIAVGTAVRLYPGCDKMAETCQVKFDMADTTEFDGGNIRNFRGEPHVPGQDVITSYPDAKY